MPSLTRKPKPDPAAIYVATETFVGDLPGAPNTLVRRGARLRGDHIAVVHMFANGSSDYFVPDGSSDEDVARARGALAGEYVGPAPDPGIRLPQPIPIERQVRATKNIWAEGGGAVLAWEGQVFEDSHPVVKQFRGDFEPVRPPAA